jgi:hypothetical protein
MDSKENNFYFLQSRFPWFLASRSQLKTCLTIPGSILILTIPCTI